MIQKIIFIVSNNKVRNRNNVYENNCNSIPILGRKG